ncbi:MAG: nucleotidyltransferase family protein [FCB group bacterium]|jgi:molybdenum cofactor cytidylyltransferase|nr:nucleotidyltransferase family protein [FCB group bacterium]
MIAAILLAAGESTRMGQSKPLLPFGGRTLVEHLVEVLLTSEVDRVYVVLGHEAERVQAVLKAHPVHPVVNVDYRQGMLSSVRRGLRVLPPETDTVLVAPVDQPGLTRALINALLNAYRLSDKDIAVPIHQGRRGHPLIFSAGYIPEILTGYDDTGLRGLLVRHAGALLEFPFDDPAVLDDTDTPEAYRRFM